MAESPLRFDFGAGGNASGVSYETARGYGFEPAAQGALGRSFSIRLPEGNYRVTLRFEGRERASTTTVAAEARRLMLQDVTVARGKFVERSCIVNVRTPALAAPPQNAPAGASVRLKAREIDSPTWDDKLTLQFIGSAAAVASLSVTSADVPTLYLAGDSTVTDQGTSPSASWGQILPRFFADRIVIANHAESGETLKAFLAELRLDKILSNLRQGDWLLLQFGHNDQKVQWPQTYVEAGTTYRAYLRAYIAEARRRGATPILVTSPERGNFDDSGRIVPSHGEYPDAVRAVAREESVALIDLYAMSKAFYETLGPQRVANAFSDGGKDRTHHSNYGAYELARMVVSGIRAADPDLIAHLADALATDAGSVEFRSPETSAAFSNASL
jgi:lysophospholipase L1-like esterase